MGTDLQTAELTSEPSCERQGLVARTHSRFRLDIAEIANAIARSYAGRSALTKPVGEAHRV